jgi:hypothetical protein
MRATNRFPKARRGFRRESILVSRNPWNPAWIRTRNEEISMSREKIRRTIRASWFFRKDIDRAPEKNISNRAARPTKTKIPMPAQ